MARRRFCWIQGGIQKYEFAIIYYKDAGDSKTVWLRDEDAAPVQIATWPKRVPLFSPQTVSGGGEDLIQGYVGFVGGENTSLDDSRETTGENTFSLSPYKNTVDVQVSPIVQGNSVTSDFTNSKTTIPAGIGGGGVFNFSGLQSLVNSSSNGSQGRALFSGGVNGVWLVNFASISNTYGVIGMIKTPAKTLFSLVDHPAVSPTILPNFTRRGRVIYGQSGAVSTASYPTPPVYDPDFDIQPAAQTYQSGNSSWFLNLGTAVDQSTSVINFNNLIGTEFGTARVYNFATDVVTENIPVPGIEAEAEKIIAIVALAV